MAIKENTQLLIQAAQQGNAAQVQRLIPVSYSKFSENAALCYAARYGHTECVRLLIPVSDPTAAESVALYYAVDGGHIECVRLLIPVSNPKDNASVALRRAYHNNDAICIDLLYPLSSPQEALHHMQTHYPDEVNVWKELERRVSTEQRGKLNQEIGGAARIKSVRRI